MKTEKIRSNYVKTGRFLGISFPSSAEFLPCFFGKVKFFHKPPGGGSLLAKIFTLVMDGPYVRNMYNAELGV